MQEIIGVAMIATLVIGIVSLMWHSGGIKETLVTITITSMTDGWVVIAIKLIFGERT